MNWAWAQTCAPDMNWTYPWRWKALFSSLFSMYTRDIQVEKKKSFTLRGSQTCSVAELEKWKWKKNFFPFFKKSLKENLYKKERN